MFERLRKLFNFARSLDENPEEDKQDKTLEEGNETYNRDSQIFDEKRRQYEAEQERRRQAERLKRGE